VLQHNLVIIRRIAQLKLSIFFMLFLPSNRLFDGRYHYPKIGYFKYKDTVQHMDRDKWSARQEFLWKLLRDIRKESNQTQVELALKLRRRRLSPYSAVNSEYAGGHLLSVRFGVAIHQN